MPGRMVSGPPTIEPAPGVPDGPGRLDRSYAHQSRSRTRRQRLRAQIVLGRRDDLSTPDLSLNA